MSGRTGMPFAGVMTGAVRPDARGVRDRVGRILDAASRLGTAVLVALVHGWQLLLRPVLGNNCRFEPGCSDYALEALRRHGVRRGGTLAARRVLRCHPFCAGGHDPVPLAPAPLPLASALAGSHRKPS